MVFIWLIPRYRGMPEVVQPFDCPVRARRAVHSRIRTRRSEWYTEVVASSFVVPVRCNKRAAEMVVPTRLVAGVDSVSHTLHRHRRRCSCHSMTVIEAAAVHSVQPVVERNIPERVDCNRPEWLDWSFRFRLTTPAVHLRWPLPDSFAFELPYCYADGWYACDAAYSLSYPFLGVGLGWVGGLTYRH